MNPFHRDFLKITREAKKLRKRYEGTRCVYWSDLESPLVLKGPGGMEIAGLSFPQVTELLRLGVV